MRKGISLPIETVIVLVLAAVVLVALLFFFGGTFTPSVDRIRLQQQQVDLCTKYVSQDSECRRQPSGDLSKEFNDVCGKLGLNTDPAVCCSSYCSSGVFTQAGCKAKGGECLSRPGSTTRYDCSGNGRAIGVCHDIDTSSNVYSCCKA